MEDTGLDDVLRATTGESASNQASPPRHGEGSQSHRGVVFALGSFLLAFAAQVYFENLRQYSLEGALLYIAAVVLLVLALLHLENIQLQIPPLPTRHSTARWLRGLAGEARESEMVGERRRGGVILLALCSGALAIVLIQGRPSSYLIAFLLWAFAGVAVCWASAPNWSWATLRDWGRRALANRREVVAVGALLVVALGLRAWSIETIPPVLGGDEGSQGLAAIDILAGRTRDPFGTGWMSVPTMSFFWQAIWLKLFGSDVLGLRLPWAVVGTASVLATYLLVRELFDRRLAFLAAALLAAYDYHVHYSRLGSNQIADPLFLATALYLLVSGFHRRRPLEFALCGVVVGLSQYFYAGARLTGLVVVLVAAFYFWKEPRLWRESKGNLAVLLASGALVAGPMIMYALQYPNEYNARINQVGIFQSGWLDREVVIRNQGALTILWDQFQRAALAFTHFPDRTTWYGNPNPLLGFPASVFFAAGLAYATIRFTDRRLFPFVIWFWSGVITGGMLTESPPSSQRLISLAVPAIFFVVLALDRLAALPKRVWGIRTSLTPVVAVVVLVLSLQSLKFYFVDFTPEHRYGSYNGWVATEMGKYLRSFGQDYRAYFFGPPRMYYGFATIPFMAPRVEGTDIPKPISAAPDFVKPDKGAIFIFLPERAAEWQWVRRAYPNGTYREFPNPLRKENFFVAYEVPRELLN